MARNVRALTTQEATQETGASETNKLPSSDGREVVYCQKLPEGGYCFSYDFLTLAHINKTRKKSLEMDRTRNDNVRNAHFPVESM